MVVRPAKFIAGLTSAQQAIRAFERGAASDFGAANKLLKSGLADISSGFQAFGAVTAASLSRAFSGAAPTVKAGLTKVSTVVSREARLMGEAFAYLYGPMFRPLTSAVSTALTALKPWAPSLATITTGLGKVSGAVLLAGRGMAKLGAAAAIKGVVGLTHAFGGMAVALRSAVNQLGLFAAGVTGVAAFGVWHIAKGAIALGEQMDRARVIFGDTAKSIVKDSDRMAKAFGITKKEYIAAASAFGTIFQGAGYDESASATLSQHFTRLATDLSSLAHIPVADAMEKLQAGLVGQIRPLREVGVSIAEVDVKAYAAAHGIAALGHEMSESEKTQARIGLITERLAKAQGNLALTADSTANQVRSLTGRLQNLADTAGTALNTILGPAVSELAVGVQALQMAWDSSALAASSASVGVVGGAQAQTGAIGVVQQAIGKVADVWQTVRLAFLYVQQSVTEGLIYMVKNLEGFASGVGKIIEYFTGSKLAAGDFTKTWLADLERMKKAQEETFAKELIKPAASEDINKAFDAARAQIKAARQDLARSIPAIAGLKPTRKDEIAQPGKEIKFASAMARGSSEAANTILQSRFGAVKPSKDEAKKQTSLQTQMRDGINKIAGAVTGGVPLMLMENL